MIIAAFSKIHIIHGLEMYEKLYAYYTILRRIPPTLHFRELFDAVQKNNPIRKDNLPAITLGIVCHPKDFEILQIAIAQAIKHSQNPINEVVLVTTKDGYAELSSRYPQYDVRSEDEVLTGDTISNLKKIVPSDRFGWVLQQIIKFSITLRAKNSSTLILDADTILVQSRTFINSQSVQALAYSYEYHQPYSAHFSKFFQLDLDNKGHSFVTHHQLMQKKIVAEMFGENGENLEAWAKAADYNVFSPLSEYHCYGEFLVRFYPKKYKIMRWGNLPISLLSFNQIATGGSVSKVEHQFKDWNSISAHSYL